MTDTGLEKLVITKECSESLTNDQERTELKVETIINSLSITDPIDPELIQLLLFIEGAMCCSDDIQLIAILRKQFESVYIDDIREIMAV